MDKGADSKVAERRGWILSRLAVILLVVVFLALSAQTARAQGEEPPTAETSVVESTTDTQVEINTAQASTSEPAAMSESETTDTAAGSALTEGEAGGDEPPATGEVGTDDGASQTGEESADSSSGDVGDGDDSGEEPVVEGGAGSEGDSPEVALSDEALLGEADTVADDSQPSDITAGSGLASDGDLVTNGELAEGGDTAINESGAGQALDPYFTRGGVTYYFYATGCGDTANCTENATPIQAAIDNIKAIGLPDDFTLYIEEGDYDDQIVIDGFTL